MKRGKDKAVPEELREALPPESEEARTWRLLDEPEAPVDLEEGWSRLTAALDEPARTRPLRLHLMRTPAIRRLAWAAVVLILIGTGTVFRERSATFVVGPGSVQSVTLPDQSIVTLNSGSSIRYRSRPLDGILTTWKRTVAFDGEGLFSISHTGSPFVVEGPRATIEVLGTRFNVRDRNESARARITLLDGIVRVRARNQPETTAEVLEEEGDSAILVDGLLARAESDVAAITSWTERGFVLVDESLRDLFRELEIRFDRHVQVAGPVELGRSINMFYQAGATFEQILHDACVAHGCTYREYSDKVIVFPAPNDPR
jgi:transmembrane sensor